jgi:hypothetical protein
MSSNGLGHHVLNRRSNQYPTLLNGCTKKTGATNCLHLPAFTADL